MRDQSAPTTFKFSGKSRPGPERERRSTVQSALALSTVETRTDCTSLFFLFQIKISTLKIFKFIISLVI